MNNPFLNSIVRDPWLDQTAEVPEIGQQAYQRCLRELENVRAFGMSRSVLLYGTSGCGKTHLIARLRRDIETRAAAKWLDSIFVAVQMVTSPFRIWRHLRRRLMEDLLRRQGSSPTQLERILFWRIAAPGTTGGLAQRFREDIIAGTIQHTYDPQHLAEVLWKIIDDVDRGGSLHQIEGDFYEKLDGSETMPLALHHCFRHLAQRRHTALASSWLRGDSLSASELATLSLDPQPAGDAPEDEAREVVLSTIRLAGVPIVFCLDQVEALQSSLSDIESLQVLGNAAFSLHDRERNVLLVSCMQLDFEGRLKSAVGSNYARLAESRQELISLSRKQAADLVRARLVGLPKELADEIEGGNFDDLFTSEGAVPARRVIERASQLFEQATNPDPAPRPDLKTALSERWERYLERAEKTETAARLDDILEQGLPLLLRLIQPDAPPPTSPGPGNDIQFTFSSAGRSVGVSICNQSSTRNALAARFSRLTKSPALPPKQIVIVRDPRLPLKQSASKTWEYLNELTQAGARIVHPSAEALAALDALRILLSEAKAGDLAHDGNSIPPATVEEWLASHIPRSLNELADDLMKNESSGDVPIVEGLLELLDSRMVVSLPEAARHLNLTEAALAAYAADTHAAIGFVVGQPSLLFQPVARAGAAS